MNYYRVMLGKGSIHAQTCYNEDFIGADYDVKQDLTDALSEEQKGFSETIIPIYLAKYPEKNKIAAGLVCGMLWTMCKGMEIGDIVLCPDGDGIYRAGRIAGNYEYKSDSILPHRRAVQWLEQSIRAAEMSEGLRKSCYSIGTVRNISAYHDELENLLTDSGYSDLGSENNKADNSTAFALERYLEDFLVSNWAQTELGQRYDIYQENEGTGQQYQIDKGYIDILAISKDKRELLVVELKKGRASDNVVGQTLRYMGAVTQALATEGQTVKGVIIAHEGDLKLRQALSVIQNVSFYRYQIDFKLMPME